MPNPWQRSEEWFIFNSFQVWSIKPGFRILASVSVPGQKYDGHPVSWVREWSNVRSFHTSLGHDAVAYEDPLFEKHLTGGIMWAVRREQLLE